MKVTVRDLKQRTEDFDFTNLEYVVADLVEQVKVRFNFPESVRLIYCGKILDHTKLLSEYFKETNAGFVVCMPERKTQSVPAATTTQSVPAVSPVSVVPVQVQNSQNVSSTNSTNANTNNKYDIRQIRALLLVFMRLIKTNPILNFLHITTEEGIQNLILDPNFTSNNGPLQSILNQSSSIADAIDSRQDFPIEIPGFDITPMNVPGLGQNLGQTTSTAVSTGNLHTGTDNLFDYPVTTNSGNIQTTLSDTDKQNIEELVQLGFTHQQATIAYVNANKDKNLAASLLFELS